MASPLEAFDAPFMRTALAQLLVLAVSGGCLGTWIVLRHLAFFTHAVGTAAFPGLVVAKAAGLAAQPVALVVALGYAGAVSRARRSEPGEGAATGLLLVAALGVGIVLASDVFEAGADVDRLLFGTSLGLSAWDVAFAAAAACLSLTATVTLGRRWLASGFDPEGTAALGLRSDRTDAVLLAVVGIAVVAALPAVGALLVTAVFITPAATVLLVVGTARQLVLWSVALAAAEATVGLYLAYSLDVSPGPAVAALGASVYAAVALTLGARRSRRRSAPAGGAHGERAAPA